ncbi:MAG: hypothetical protein HKN73_04450 [Gemmatimonadetes bacterium]|nr:hypothetical protein [Gemmatimonadota bacterium]
MNHPQHLNGAPALRLRPVPIRAGLWLLLLLVTIAPGVAAQSLLSVEASPRIALPVSTFGDQGAETTLGFTGMVFVRVFSPLSVYGGWDRTSFGCGPCSGSGTIRVSGPYAGLEAQLAPERRVRPWFRAGFSRRSTESDIATATIEMEQSWAIHVAMGLHIGIQDRLAVITGARFETLDPSLDVGADATELGTPVSYVSFDLGLRLNVLP